MNPALLLVLGCTGAPGPRETPPGTGGDTATAADTADSALELPVPAPSLDAAGVAAAIDRATAAGIPDPVLAREAYLSIFLHRDPECPGGQGTNLPGRFEGCTAESGWLFAGLAEYTGPQEPHVIDDFHLLGDFNVRDADGRWFIGGGELEVTTTRAPGAVTWTGAISGTWSWPGGSEWMLPEGAGGVLEMTVERADPAWRVAVDGALTDGTEALHLTGVTADDATCDGAATGRIALRDPSGHWYTLDATCGCGPVTWADGGALGEACVSLDLSTVAGRVRP